MTADITPTRDSAGYETLALPRRALKALGAVDGLIAGPLSPLGRMEAPAGAADAGALITAWEKLEGAWAWAVPALLDPRRTIALVMGDGNSNLVGQYLFPDPDAYGPGFQVSVGEDALTLTGPLTLGLLGIGLYSHLALEDVAEAEPYRSELPSSHLWALAACLDAFRAAALERRLQRSGGAPLGISRAEVEKAWTDGVSRPNPGWAVSLFSLLAPDGVPEGLPEGLGRLLADMARQGWLIEAAGPRGELYALPDFLSSLLWGLTTAFDFGLVSLRLADRQVAETTALAGWRTPGGVWLADLSGLAGGRAALALVGPSLALEIIDNALGEDSMAPPWEEFAFDTPFTRDAVLARLRASGTREETADVLPSDRHVSRESRDDAADAAHEGQPGELSGFCPACGKPLRQGARFCRQCGKKAEPGEPLAEAMPGFCPACGKPLREGARFCRGCGHEVRGSANDQEHGSGLCPSCGEKVREGVRFCRNCGTEL